MIFFRFCIYSINFIEIVVEFEPKVNSKVNYYETVDFENKLYPNYTIESGLIVKKLSENKEEKFEFDIEAFFKDKFENLNNYVQICNRLIFIG